MIFSAVSLAAALVRVPKPSEAEKSLTRVEGGCVVMVTIRGLRFLYSSQRIAMPMGQLTRCPQRRGFSDGSGGGCHSECTYCGDL